MLNNLQRKQCCSLSIPPSLTTRIATAGYHGSSRSLNLPGYYKAIHQYPNQIEAKLDGYPINTYTAELDYSVTTKSSIKDLHSIHTPNVDRPVQSRHNSIVIAQDPRFSAFVYPHTVQLLNNTHTEPNDSEAKDVALYCKLAWLSCLFFLPLGIIALKKFYESKRFRHKNPERAEAASEVTRFVGTFAILLGMITYMLILAVRLRITYEKGESFL